MKLVPKGPQEVVVNDERNVVNHTLPREIRGGMVWCTKSIYLICDLEVRADFRHDLQLLLVLVRRYKLPEIGRGEALITELCEARENGRFLALALFVRKRRVCLWLGRR